MRLSEGLLYLGLLIVGVALGVFFCNYSYFVFEKEISYFDLFSLVVTTSLGIYITVRIGRVLNKENSEKQLLIDEVKVSIKLVDEINSKIDARSFSIQSMASEFKMLNENLHLIVKLLEASHCKSVKADILRDSFKTCRRALTGYRVVNNNVSLTPSQATNGKRLSSNLKQQYFKLIFSINNV
ncbi:MAG: hypothetical protein EOO43_09845 [Flavobacterium sp.]|nr:MAG: hypothetical protein EOO43_09845 [Flavobacterium sp.]